MRQNSKQLQCSYHGQPIIKIELNSRKLICNKCVTQTESDRRYRLELLRVKLSKEYQIELRELRDIKGKIDKIVEVFLSKNMVQAKKLINKSLPDLQKKIDILLEEEINQANVKLKEFIEQEMSKWANIDGKQFHQGYFLFQQQYSKIQESINQIKREAKSKIAIALKNELRAFYSILFDF